MTTNPIFQAPSSATVDAARTSPIIEVDKALESMRDAGFDLTAAVGEPIDNSIEANATVIRIEPMYSKDRKHITEIAFADNGRGIDLPVLAKVLKMGYSSRYGQRKGLGRFGVGLKLAALSVGTRIEVYAKAAGSNAYYLAYLDLDEISAGSQTEIRSVEVGGWPKEYVDLMKDFKGEPFESGTLVLWQHIDRLSSGGTYGASLDTKIADLRKFIARAYRQFLDQGLNIILAGKPVTLHDPLFLLDDPRIQTRYGMRDGLGPDSLKGKVIEETDLTIDDHQVHVSVSIAPEIFRHEKGKGGETDLDGRDIREFQINQDNEGRISMMRNGREIYYDIVPRMLTGGVTVGDRYIGIEVSFPAELDEYFQVRHVKRGAEPVSKLRNALREWLKRPVTQARKEIRRHWDEVRITQQAESVDGRDPAVQEAVDRAEQTAPRGQASLNLTLEQESAKIDEILDELEINTEANANKADGIRAHIAQHSMTILDGNWPGKELMTVDHLNAKAILRLNHRHPFIRDIYDVLRETADKPFDEQDAAEMHNLIRRTSMALDMLFLAYAKAENLHREPEEFEDLRSYWGQHTQAYMKELVRFDE
ncbi:ATP-binding protein [Arthrobacter sp. CAU 1506]|uniref:ATP-binding protein n=1 Tax=Arthrobacter sp. CAU 1506 TaxID=2560052 RepID=UPI0010AD6841|nr:ATP-binding protein [Arthrobacter sp. CAU 1506]TJY69468.1 ATP-binding protein [Arthrobacter sp. CAU 1506]